MSKFDKIFEARGSGEEKAKTTTEIKDEAPGKVKKTSAKAKIKDNSAKNINQNILSSAARRQAEAPTTENAQKRRGRPQAKRSDPAYIGFTTYIRKDTHLKVKIALLQEGQGRELSQLVEELLGDYLKNR